ncbi:uncharacterized protein LOC114784876 [Denticeps clupeoides]|nr:uncharacterized protein LOC114784876 [Denticeps clupeoides]
MMHDDMCNNKEDIQRLMGPQGPRDTSEAVSTSSEFTHHAIVLLVEAMRQRWDMYGSRERSRLFQSVQEELEGHGYPLPVERIRRKWNNLIVTYKRVKERCRGSSQAKTSWEYFEAMDSLLGKTAFAQRSSASATLLGLATTAKAAALTEERASPVVPDVAATCLFPPGLIAGPAQVPALVPPSLLCTAASEDSLPSASSQTPPPRRKLRRPQPGAASSFLSHQHGQAEKRNALLRSFLSGQEERAQLEEQRLSRAEARERRRERLAGKVVDTMGRMATALELISSKQDTIIALLQRLADKH